MESMLKEASAVGKNNDKHAYLNHKVLCRNSLWKHALGITLLHQAQPLDFFHFTGQALFDLRLRW